jgi:hypothetical protein
MLRAAIIGAAAGFVFSFVGAIITPLCNPCTSALVGLCVGILAAHWERSEAGGQAAGAGAKAAAIAGSGSLAGQMAGAVVNGLTVGPQGIAELYRQLRIRRPPSPELYWVSNLGGNCLCGLVAIMVAAAFGALGAVIWFSAFGRSGLDSSDISSVEH